MIGKGGFSNSVIDAETLSRVSLGTLSSSNGGVPFGLASSDIVSLTATIDGKRVTISRHLRRRRDRRPDQGRRDADGHGDPNCLMIRINCCTVAGP